MRDLFARGEAIAECGKDGEAAGSGSFRAAGKEPLEADTDAQEGRSGGDFFLDCSCKAVVREEPRGREVADAGEDDALGGSEVGGVLRYGDFGCEVAQGLNHGREVAGLVIDDGHLHQSSPLVLGSISLSCGSRAQAKRRARAKALNSASILWWLERP